MILIIYFIRPLHLSYNLSNPTYPGFLHPWLSSQSPSARVFHSHSWEFIRSYPSPRTMLSSLSVWLHVVRGPLHQVQLEPLLKQNTTHFPRLCSWNWEGERWSVFVADSHRRVGWVCSLATVPWGPELSHMKHSPSPNLECVSWACALADPHLVPHLVLRFFGLCFVLPVKQNLLWFAFFSPFSLTSVGPDTYFLIFHIVRIILF